MKTIIGFLLLVSMVLGQSKQKQKEFNYNFQQNDYHLVYDHMEVVRYNKKYVKHYTIKNFKYNRTTKALNASFVFNVDFGYDLEVVVQAYKFLSNEYRYFPMRLGVHYCKALSANIIGASDFMKCGNFTGCPFVKDRHYFFCNWKPDEVKLPPLIPSGSYMLEVQALYNSEEVYVLRAFASITRPEV